MKLPAYAKTLLAARRAGSHPALVTVVYGEDWAVPGAECRLAVKPGEALGLDWRCVAGLPVELVNRSDVAMFEAQDGEPLRLAAEIARESAQVMVVEGGARVALDELAFAMRCVSGARWPAWWSEDVEKIHGQNRKRWIEEAAHYLSGFCP